MPFGGADCALNASESCVKPSYEGEGLHYDAFDRDKGRSAGIVLVFEPSEKKQCG